MFSGSRWRESGCSPAACLPDAGHPRPATAAATTATTPGDSENGGGGRSRARSLRSGGVVRVILRAEGRVTDQRAGVLNEARRRFGPQHRVGELDAVKF